MKVHVIILTLFLGCTHFSHANIWHAKPNTSGLGTSWQDATSDLQLLINSAASGDTIFVAEGAYKPMRPADNLGVVDVANRKNAFVIKKDVKVFGGFPGSGNPGFADRDYTLFITVLNGDIGNLNDSLDNCYHVMVSVGDMGTATINGFTVRKAYGYPMGDYTIDSVTVYNGNGGGISLVGVSNLTISDVIFDSNYSYAGAGIACYQSSPILSNIIAINNSAVFGGGMLSMENSIPNLFDVKFINNISMLNGGAICNKYASRTHITRGYFYNNRSTAGLGGAISNETTQGLVRYENVVFHSNYSLGGGAIYNSLTSTSIVNCIFRNNYAIGSSTSTGWGGAIICDPNGGTSHVTNSTFYGNYAKRGGAIWAFISQPVLTNSIFWNNTATEQFYESTGNFLQTGSGLISPIVNYCLLQPMDSALLNTGNNLFVQPQFKDSVNGDFRLACNSPGINSGTDSVYFQGQTPDISHINSDLNDNARISNWKVDMGAYEYRFEGDSISVDLCRGDVYTYNGISYSPPFFGYVDTFSNQDGCDSFRVLKLLLIPVDTSVFVIDDSLFANVDNASYQWIDCKADSIVQGANEQKFRPSSSGDYRVVITKNGCTDTSSCHSFQINETSIKKVPSSYKGISIYPNPTTECINITLDDNRLLQTMIEIIDLQGRVVMRKPINKSKQTISLSSLTPGVYMVKTENGVAIKIKKL